MFLVETASKVKQETQASQAWLVTTELLVRPERREMLVHKELLVLRDPKDLLVCPDLKENKDPLYVTIDIVTAPAAIPLFVAVGQKRTIWPSRI